MELKELFTTLWPQVTLLLLGIGYLIKLPLDTKSKKNEINHTLYQQNRLTTVNRFFESYADAERLWNEISIYKVFERKYDTIELDSLTWPILNDLNKSLFPLMMCFEEDDFQRFKKLVSNMWAINQNISESYWEIDSRMTVSKKVASFHNFKNKAYKENKELINELSKSMKHIFNT